MANKSTPTGIRFDPDQLEFIKKREKIDSPQKVVNFLLKAYWDVWHVPKNPFNAGVPERTEAVIPVKKTIKKSYDFFFSQIKSLEQQEECNDFVAEVESSDLPDFEKKKLKDTLKSKWL